MTNEENKLNEAIKQNGIEMQSEILDKLKRRYPQYVEQPNRNKETEKISEALYGLSIDTKIDCLYVADFLVRQGIGDKKQAVKEFCEKFKARIEGDLWIDRFVKNLIDELFTELYGGNNDT